MVSRLPSPWLFVGLQPDTPAYFTFQGGDGVVMCGSDRAAKDALKLYESNVLNQQEELPAHAQTI
jgi:hypothetical protein